MNTVPISAPTSAVKPMAVVYLRVSTKEQAGRGGEAEGFSIPAQRDACLRKGEALGAQVVAEFVDAGESARSANRPELQRMLAFVAEHRVGFVIVHKVDRLARNRVDDVEINLALRAAGSQLVSCSENIDETPSGMLLHGIMSSIAEFYSRNLATESKKGMLQKAKNGGTPGRAPFGYLNTRERSDDGHEVRAVALDPDRGHWVRWLYERYATGEWTTAMLAEQLAEHGVTTLPTPKRGSAPLATSQVAAILGNRYYVGVVSFAGVEYPGRHEALVDAALFEKVQQVRRGRVASQEKPRVHTHYLKGSVYCGQCGEPLSYEVSRGRSGATYEYFYCLGRQRYRNGCGFRAVQVRFVEELVEDHWATVTLAETDVAEIRRLVLEHIRQSLPAQESERDAARTRLLALDRESDKLLQAHYADAINLDDLKREQARIATSRALIERDLSRTVHNEEFLNDRLDSCCRLLARAQQHYLAAEPVARRDFNQGVFKRLYVNEDEVAGSDLTPAFQRLMSGSLSTDLQSERKRHRNPLVRTARLQLVPPPTPQATRGERSIRQDLTVRLRRTSPLDRLTPRLGFERPRGQLPWEQKNPGQVRGSSVENATLVAGGSNEAILVGATGIEPVTACL